MLVAGLASANVQLGLCGYHWLAALEPGDAGDPQLSCLCSGNGAFSPTTGCLGLVQIEL